MLLRFLPYLVLILGQLMPMAASARWGTIDDASTEIELYDRDIVVNKDGSSIETITTRVKILKESGRNIWANYPLVYNSNISKVNIIEAKTIYAGKEYPLTADLIEDKPLASSPQGFDQYNQISLAYPNAEIGAELYLKYQSNNTVPLLDNFFATDFIYGEGGYWSKSTVTLKSELPLYIGVNDPEKILQVTTNVKSTAANPTFTELTITLKQPVYKGITDEPYYLLDPKLLPWITVSSVNTWDELANKLGPKYIEVINQPLPEQLQPIVTAAKAANSDTDKINLVTSMLAAKIQYMGDWKTVAGKFMPHDLQHIADKQLGDCKDFTVSAGAILQTLGYKVQPVLAMRGLYSRQPATSLPSLSHANHAMLKVTMADNTVRWIDPTNFVSMADGTFPDISNKSVFIIAPTAAKQEMSAAIDPEHMQLIVNQQLDLSKPGTIKAQGTINLNGEHAINITGAQMLTSNETIKEVVFSIVGNEYLAAKKTITLPDLQSRIVKNLTFKFEYEQENPLIKTNLGAAIHFPMPENWISEFINIKGDQISDVFIGPPRTLTFNTDITGFPVTNSHALDYKITTKWLDVTREVKTVNDITKIHDVIKIKGYFIPNAETKLADYTKLKQKLVENFRDVILISAQ